MRAINEQTNTTRNTMSGAGKVWFSVTLFVDLWFIYPQNLGDANMADAGRQVLEQEMNVDMMIQSTSQHLAYASPPEDDQEKTMEKMLPTDLENFTIKVFTANYIWKG